MIRSLYFLRFIAAILVVIFHFGRQSYPFNLLTVQLFTEYLAASVSFFFVLSGFVLAISYIKKKALLHRTFIGID